MGNMNRIKGLLLIYAVLGVTFIFVVVILLIPEKVQMAAESIGMSPKPTGEVIGAASGDYRSMVARHMILPEGVPAVVPIENPDELKAKQAMFAGAQKGDVILVFSTKVILYRPTADRIVEVAQIKGK